MVSGEISAFEIDDEEMKGPEPISPAIQADELSKERQQIVSLRKELSEKYRPLAIDITAVREFFQRFRTVVNDETMFWEAIEAMTDTIVHEYEMCEYDPISQVMCIRGLFLLMLNEHFADYMGQSVSEKILNFVTDVLREVFNEETREEANLSEHPPVI